MQIQSVGGVPIVLTPSPHNLPQPTASTTLTAAPCFTTANHKAGGQAVGRLLLTCEVVHRSARMPLHLRISHVVFHEQDQQLNPKPAYEIES